MVGEIYLYDMIIDLYSGRYYHIKTNSQVLEMRGFNVLEEYTMMYIGHEHCDTDFHLPNLFADWEYYKFLYNGEIFYLSAVELNKMRVTGALRRISNN